MKKYIFLLFTVCMQFAPAKAQWVAIPDTNFVNKLTQLYPSCMNGNLMDTTCSPIVNEQFLDVYNNYIHDLTGIRYFDNLTFLKFSYNLITNLPQLPNTLKTLNCDNNLLTNLSSFQLPDSLLNFDCSQNQITDLPALPNRLEWLDCSFNQLTYLPQMPDSLQRLHCQHNQLTSVPRVPNNMIVFQITHNSISCLNNLPQATPGLINNNQLTCVPNQTNYSLGLPLCFDNDLINNPNNCPGVNITGNIYTDMDSNCIYNTTDWGNQNIPVKLFDSQNNLVAQSYTLNGIYSFASILPDTFHLKIEDNLLPVSMGCGQSNTQFVTLDSTNQTISNINFPIVCDSVYDIQVQYITALGWVFPGQFHTIYTTVINNLSWYNLNCFSSAYSGIVTINVSGPLTFASIANNALTPQINGNTFTYSIADFNNLTPASFGLIFITNTNAQVNDQICVHAQISGTPVDADTTNNVDYFCYQVVNSYDPNMKEVYPVNVLPGYDDWFTYTIHFQNTGNAPAFNIRLRDTLDTNLDLNTFEIRGYSHPAIVSINGNILTVRFNNIMLPDSTTDYEGSMGYFQYRIKPLANLPLGTQIENTAYIYFDYNAPIITNTTQNNFQFVVKTKNTELEEAQYVLFPNPSAGIFIFKESKNIKTIEVFNIMGELILSQGSSKQINLQAYPKGIYVARINGAYVSRLVKE